VTVAVQGIPLPVSVEGASLVPQSVGLTTRGASGPSRGC
jgi:hypothetical protein